MLLPFLVHTPWDYCMHHPIDDPDCERNRPFAETVVGWHSLSPKLYIYDYYRPYPTPHGFGRLMLPVFPKVQVF